MHRFTAELFDEPCGVVFFGEAKHLIPLLFPDDGMAVP
jgi:hypothetical protein